MAMSRFVYVTYIRATPEKLWRALIEPEFTRQYWVGTIQESEWKKGASWKMIAPDGRLTDSGEIIEIEPYKRLVFSWRNEFQPAVKAEGYSRCTYDLEETHGVVKLTVTHEMDIEDAQLIVGVSSGWPYILATLKSLLETGKAFEGSDKFPEGI
ncbi:MAG TPA: SRPBCC family protein [Caulobacterales bacterium]|nr:SRPBCC family protein [Caulobacterales bacterium]